MKEITEMHVNLPKAEGLKPRYAIIEQTEDGIHAFVYFNGTDVAPIFRDDMPVIKAAMDLMGGDDAE